MSFLRHEEIYRSDVRPATAGSGNPWSPPQCPIGCDEFPVGYSLAGCPPAEPASASPTGDDSQQSTFRTMIFQRTATTPLTSCLSPRVHSKRPPYPDSAQSTLLLLSLVRIVVPALQCRTIVVATAAIRAATCLVSG